MKIEESTIRDVKDLNGLESYILLNTVHKNENEEEVIEKELLNAPSIASKTDLITLEEQNRKLVELIQNFVQKINEQDKRISELEKLIKTPNKEESSIEDKFDKIYNLLMENTLER